MIFETMSSREAMERAVKHFKCSEEELRIEELESPSTKMVGLVKKCGKFNIEKVKSEIKEDPNNRDGHVEIIDGKLAVTDATGKDSQPSVFIKGPQMDTFLNGEKASVNTILSAQDQVSFAFEDIPAEKHLEVEFSNDKVCAYLTIERKYGKRFHLKDIPKSRKTVLEPGFDLVEPKKVSFKECISTLVDYGIKRELIDEAAVREGCEAKETVKVVAAKGKSPVAGRKTEFYYCEELRDKEILQGLEPIVRKGDLLAKKIMPAIMGYPGMNVLGEIIEVLPVEDEELIPGKGAEKRGDELYSLVDGRPFGKNGQIGVMPLLTVIGDLDKDTDDIDFDGDVVVKGNVQDNMVIRATGNVKIMGSVHHSQIFAMQNIDVEGKVVGGRLQAGDENSIFHVIVNIVEEMTIEIEKIFKGLHQVEVKDEREILEIINIGKDNLDELIKEMERSAVSMNISQLETLNELKKSILHAFLEMKLLHRLGFAELKEIYQTLKDYKNLMDEELKDIKILRVKYAKSATVNSSGDIIITGEGSYQSNLMAGRKVICEKSSSVVKGGTIIAGKQINAGVVGAPSEIATFCKVLDGEGDIKGRFYKGTTLVVKNIQKEYVAIE
ncbi:FapA family protein [Alkalibacter saccharofermentans]|uniref:Flagellar Assembly Protein A N-terminal region domain-containing protein n=1 Tax=Alkalibacter saccharofermentans DSM 14828 TaxID=1120975 RepID=A0A1M4VKB3_9FIRM|nr:FapA family protein [Alkalibacter saccharofermentans]SHE69424.1 hypothetical protein SAMN02746064_01024 [Alkalibacter saccharofermentans DSM 14828]